MRLNEWAGQGRLTTLVSCPTPQTGLNFVVAYVTFEAGRAV